MKTVKFIIANGEVIIEASGFKGGACDAATKAFEEVLGGKLSNKKRKTEYFEKVAPEYVNVRGGAK